MSLFAHIDAFPGSTWVGPGPGRSKRFSGRPGRAGDCWLRAQSICGRATHPEPLATVMQSFQAPGKAIYADVVGQQEAQQILS